jgi:hypothetical protein
MAMTKTVTVEKIQIHPTNTDMEGNDLGPVMMIQQSIVVDDPDDDQLPLQSRKTINIQADTDTSGFDPLIQRIAAAVWAD